MAIYDDITKQALDVLTDILSKPNGKEIFHHANIIFLLKELEPEVSQEEILILAQKTAEAARASGNAFLIDERVDAVRYLLQYGISDRREENFGFPVATPDQMKALLLTCSLDVFTKIIDTVALENESFYALCENEYTISAEEAHKLASDAIKEATQKPVSLEDRITNAQQRVSVHDGSEKHASHDFGCNIPEI